MKTISIQKRPTEEATNNNQETFIPDYSGTPTDLKSSCDDFQLAQINNLQQAFKEQAQTKDITVQ